MPDKVRRIVYYYTSVPDTPGEAYRVLGILKEAGVNLLAFSAFPAEPSRAQVDLVPEDPAALVAACRRAGIHLSDRREAFLIDGAERPGAVAESLLRLADAGVNVTAVDAVCAGGGRFGAILWVKPAAVAEAARALGL